MEEDALRMGMTLPYFWSLTPKEWIKHTRVFVEKEEKRLKEIDTFNYVLGKYIMFAVNDPKKYPKEPFTEKAITTQMKPMNDAEMERQARRNTIKMGGVINE